MSEVDRPPLSTILRGLAVATPFVGPEALERQIGRTFRARVGANESAFGVSPLAAEAMRQAIASAAWYGDPECFELREALAARLGVERDEIVVGAGIDELLGVVVRMAIDPGQAVVTSKGAYPTFNYHVGGFGGHLHAVPYRDDKEDPEALLEEVHATNAPLVYLSNPDNPMGSWHHRDTIHQLIRGLPPTTILLLDEAYHEFAPADAVLPLDTSDPRIVRMRTFSKAHGMAGARIGYAIAERGIIAAIGKIRNQFGVSRIAQAGALASLQDEAFVASVVGAVEAGREDYAALAERLGMTPLPSATNFLTIDVGGAARARALLRALQDEGIFIRMPGVPPLDRCIRLTVGSPAERAMVAAALEALVGQGM